MEYLRFAKDRVWNTGSCREFGKFVISAFNFRNLNVFTKFMSICLVSCINDWSAIFQLFVACYSVFDSQRSEPLSQIGEAGTYRENFWGKTLCCSLQLQPNTEDDIPGEITEGLSDCGKRSGHVKIIQYVRALSIFCVWRSRFGIDLWYFEGLVNDFRLENALSWLSQVDWQSRDITDGKRYVHDQTDNAIWSISEWGGDMLQDWLSRISPQVSETSNLSLRKNSDETHVVSKPQKVDQRVWSS